MWESGSALQRVIRVAAFTKLTDNSDNENIFGLTTFIMPPMHILTCTQNHISSIIIYIQKNNFFWPFSDPFFVVFAEGLPFPFDRFLVLALATVGLVDDETAVFPSSRSNCSWRSRAMCSSLCSPSFESGNSF